MAWHAGDPASARARAVTVSRKLRRNTMSLALIALVPVALQASTVGPGRTVVAHVLRWALLVVVVVGLAVLYRMAPVDRSRSCRQSVESCR